MHAEIRERAKLQKIANFILQRIDSIALVVTIVGTLIYLVALAIRTPFDFGAFLAQTIAFALTIGAFTTSLLFFLVVAFQEDSWFGNVKPYRFHIGVGCLIASLAMGLQIVEAVLAVP